MTSWRKRYSVVEVKGPEGSHWPTMYTLELRQKVATGRDRETVQRLADELNEIERSKP